jgi:hypothetical protein
VHVDGGFQLHRVNRIAGHLIGFQRQAQDAHGTAGETRRAHFELIGQRQEEKQVVGRL